VPHVAGWAALYLEGRPAARPPEVKAALQAAATRGALSMPAGALPGTPNALLYVGGDLGGGGAPAAVAYGRRR
jgi:hypothetical protein